MEEIIIDCAAIRTKEALHQHFRDALGFPDWYGNNLDALYDQLTSIGVDTQVILQNWSEAEASLDRYAVCARQAMEDAQQNNPKLKIVLE